MSAPQIPGAPLDPDFINAVCELVAAVLVEHCLPVGTEGHLNEEHTVECALIVLRKIRAAPELSSLHSWADRLLANPDLPSIKWSDVPGHGGPW
jgi:hypothetical protein